MAILNPPAWLQAGSYDARRDRMVYSTMMQSVGAINADSMRVEAQASPNMSVRISGGYAFVSSGNEITGYYNVVNDAYDSLTIPDADPTNPRIDVVVLRVYDAEYSGSTNLARFEVVVGSPSSSPTVPSIPSTSIELARVTVPAAATSIVNANINRSNKPITSLRYEQVSGGRPAAWQSYTPSLANMSLGNGSFGSSAWTQIGRTVHFRCNITFGTTTNISSLAIVGIPRPIASSETLLGTGVVVDASAGAQQMIMARPWTGTSAGLYLANGLAVAPGSPWTWASGDVIQFSGTYETSQLL